MPNQPPNGKRSLISKIWDPIRNALFAKRAHKPRVKKRKKTGLTALWRTVIFLPISRKARLRIIRYWRQASKPVLLNVVADVLVGATIVIPLLAVVLALLWFYLQISPGSFSLFRRLFSHHLDGWTFLHNFLMVLFPIVMILIVAVAFVIILGIAGAAARNQFTEEAVAYISDLPTQLPGLGPIYSFLRKLVKGTIESAQSDEKKKVGYFRFSNSIMVGAITFQGKYSWQVFVATSPNPTNGQTHGLMPGQVMVGEAGMGDLFKYLSSAGNQTSEIMDRDYKRAQELFFTPEELALLRQELPLPPAIIERATEAASATDMTLIES